MVRFTKSEIKALEEIPEAIRLVACWREMQQDCADITEAGTKGDGIRALELRAQADLVEKSS